MCTTRLQPCQCQLPWWHCQLSQCVCPCPGAAGCPGDTASSLSVSVPAQVLQGAQLIAVASAEPTAGGVDGSPLQGSDIQVQYVQLTPVTEHAASSQVWSTPSSFSAPPCALHPPLCVLWCWGWVCLGGSWAVPGWICVPGSIT